MRAQSLAQGLARDLLARIERLEQLQLVADERCELDRIVTEAESLIHKRLGGEFPSEVLGVFSSDKRTSSSLEDDTATILALEPRIRKLAGSLDLLEGKFTDDFWSIKTAGCQIPVQEFEEHVQMIKEARSLALRSFQLLLVFLSIASNDNTSKAMTEATIDSAVDRISGNRSGLKALCLCYKNHINHMYECDFDT